MDTRGLVASLTDASTDAPDPTGRLALASTGELTATQDGMHALAADTGGKALFNTNDLSKGPRPRSRRLRSTICSPGNLMRNRKEKRFRNLEVRLINRPDLSVRVRRVISTPLLNPWSRPKLRNR